MLERGDIVKYVGYEKPDGRNGYCLRAGAVGIVQRAFLRGGQYRVCVQFFADVVDEPWTLKDYEVEKVTT